MYTTMNKPSIYDSESLPQSNEGQGLVQRMKNNPMLAFGRFV